MLQELQNYLDLISYRLKEPAFDIKETGKGEKHHIIPKSLNKRQNVLDLFKEYGYTDIKQVAHLTYREHIRVHYWLQIICEKLLDKYCFERMCYGWERLANDHKHNGELNEEEYENARKNFINTTKNKSCWNKGLTKETDERIKISGEKCSKTKKEMFANGDLISPNKGLTKENCERIKIMAEKVSISLKKCHELGKLKTWNKGLTKETDERIRIIGEKGSKTLKDSYKTRKLKVWCEGKTKETDERIKQYGEKSSKTKKEIFANGELKIWCEGLTKETDERLRIAGEKCSKTKKEKGISKGKNNSQAKAIVQLTLDNKLVREYEYIGQVEEYGFSRTNINDCINHKNFTKLGDNVYGKLNEEKFRWLSKEEYNKKDLN